MGHRATAPDLPCDSPDAGLKEYTETALDALGGDTDDLVIVGHSLGCLTVPLIGSRVKARRLVFLAGIIGAPNSSLEQLAETDAARDADMGKGALTFNDKGMFTFTERAARECLYPDCDEPTTVNAIARLRYQRSMWTQVAEFDDWPDTDIMSITCTDDRVVTPAWSDEIARTRLGVEPVHLDSGHSPFLSRPDELAALLTGGL